MPRGSGRSSLIRDTIPSWVQGKTIGEYQVDFSFDSMQFNLDVIEKQQQIFEFACHCLETSHSDIRKSFSLE